MDQETSNYVSGALSGAASGAVAGSTIAPGYGTLIGGVVGAGLGLYGAYQTNEALDNAPKYEIPEEIKKNLSEAEFYATQGMSEEAKRLLVKGIQEQQAAQMAAGSTRKAGLVGLAASQQQQQNAYAQLAAQDAMAREQHRAQLAQARSIMADYKGQQYQLNVLNPYYEKTAANQAMIGAGMQNIYGAAQAYGSTQKKSTTDNSGGSTPPTFDMPEKNPNDWGNYSNSLKPFDLPEYNIQQYSGIENR